MALASAAAVLAQDTMPPVQSYYPSSIRQQPFWGRRLTGYLATRDGTQLRYSVLLPNGKGPISAGAMPGSMRNDEVVGVGVHNVITYPPRTFGIMVVHY